MVDTTKFYNYKAADMETMNVIFENYGGQQIGRIFRNYFRLTLLLQQLMFSFYIIPAYQPGNDTLPGEYKNNMETITDEYFPEEKINWIQALQHILLMAQLEIEKSIAPEEYLNQK